LAKVAEVKQPAASTTLLDPATGKPADTFDLTNVDEINATLAKLTVDELSASMRGLSPEVVSKIEVALAVIEKKQGEKGIAEAAPAVKAAGDQTTEDAKADAADS